jgi:hypothetical protein
MCSFVNHTSFFSLLWIFPKLRRMCIWNLQQRQQFQIDSLCQEWNRQTKLDNENQRMYFWSCEVNTNRRIFFNISIVFYYVCFWWLMIVFQSLSFLEKFHEFQRISSEWSEWTVLCLLQSEYSPSQHSNAMQIKIFMNTQEIIRSRNGTFLVLRK